MQDIPAPALLQQATDELSHSDHGMAWRSYISEQMAALAAYDSKRPAGHLYEFHIHARRVASLMQNFARHLGWDDKQASTLYWAALPHDIGKTALPVHIWDRDEKPSAAEKALRRTHVQEGLTLVKQDCAQEDIDGAFGRLLLTIMENHHEAMDGCGLFAKSGKELDIISRMSCICDGFDGWSVWRPHFGDRDITINGVITRMQNEKKGHFDAELLRHFRDMLDITYENDKNFVDQFTQFHPEV